MRGILVAAALWLAPAFAQSGTTPRGAVTDYPVSAVARRFAIGAEYMVRSFGEHNRTFTTDAYIVAEVAFYPARDQRPVLSIQRLHVLINGKDRRYAQTPEMVAAAIRYPDWEPKRGLEPSIGVGPVVIGGPPRPAERFPGDRRPEEQGRIPQPTPTPGPDDVARADKTVEAADVAALEFALPEGVAQRPRSGFVYFAYKGKPSKIRKLELVYRDEDESLVTLKLK